MIESVVASFVIEADDCIEIGAVGAVVSIVIGSPVDETEVLPARSVALTVNV